MPISARSAGKSIVTSVSVVERANCNGVVSYIQNEFADVPNNGDVEILLRIGPGPVSAVSRTVKSSAGSALYRVYIAPTVSSDGALLPSRNLNDVDPKAAGYTAFLSPTVTSDGTLIDRVPVYGSSSPSPNQPQISGFSGENRLYRILAPNTDYLIRITNVSGGTENLWYNLALTDCVILSAP